MGKERGKKPSPLSTHTTKLILFLSLSPRPPSLPPCGTRWSAILPVPKGNRREGGGKRIWGELACFLSHHSLLPSLIWGNGQKKGGGEKKRGRKRVWEGGWRRNWGEKGTSPSFRPSWPPSLPCMSPGTCCASHRAGEEPSSSSRSQACSSRRRAGSR